MRAGTRCTWLPAGVACCGEQVHCQRTLGLALGVHTFVWSSQSNMHCRGAAGRHGEGQLSVTLALLVRPAPSVLQPPSPGAYVSGGDDDAALAALDQRAWQEAGGAVR